MFKKKSLSLNKLLNDCLMLRMYKEILTKVSFDRQLFKKELFKAMKWVGSPLELYQFKMWCMQEFGKKHPEVLQEVFEEIK